MHTPAQTCFALLETLLRARRQAQTEGVSLSAEQTALLWQRGGGHPADAAAVCQASDPAAALTARLLVQGSVDPGELASLHQRVHAMA